MILCMCTPIQSNSEMNIRGSYVHSNAGIFAQTQNGTVEDLVVRYGTNIRRCGPYYINGRFFVADMIYPASRQQTLRLKACIASPGSFSSKIIVDSQQE